MCRILKHKKHSKEKNCSECNSRSWYQIGYEDGKKEGLLEATKMIEGLLKEQQLKIDSLFVYEGED